MAKPTRMTYLVARPDGARARGNATKRARSATTTAQLHRVVGIVRIAPAAAGRLQHERFVRKRSSARRGRLAAAQQTSRRTACSSSTAWAARSTTWARCTSGSRTPGFVTHSLTLPGHGTDPEDLAGVTAEDWIDAVIAKYREVRDQHPRLHVMGMCMGALLAAVVAQREKHAKGNLVMLAPPVFIDGWATPWYRGAAAAAVLRARASAAR